MSAHRSRVVAGLCHWEQTDRFHNQFVELRRSDPFAFAAFVSMMEDAERPGGLGMYAPDRDYRIPLKRAPRKVHSPPWMGELKVTGKPESKRGAALEHRLYFGEPTNIEGVVVAVGLGVKRPSDAAASRKQDDQVAAAMAHLKWWFTQHGYEWANL